jgi:hypothetical protein
MTDFKGRILIRQSILVKNENVHSEKNHTNGHSELFFIQYPDGPDDDRVSEIHIHRFLAFHTQGTDGAIEVLRFF